MTSDKKIDVKVPGLDDMEQDRQAYTVGVSFKETVVTGVQVLAENEDHAKELAEEILRGKEEAKIEEIKIFDAYEMAKAQAIFNKNQADMLERLAEMVDEELEDTDEEPTIN